MQHCRCQMIAIDSYHPAEDDGIPVIPLCDVPADRWPGDESSGLGWYLMFAGFAALMLMTVLVGVLITKRDRARDGHGWDESIAHWMADHRPTWLAQIAEITSLAGPGRWWPEFSCGGGRIEAGPPSYHCLP